MNTIPELVAIADPVGSVIGGSYRLKRVIGEGGMGTVYEAMHVRLDKRFAVKLMAPELACDDVALARFQREAAIASHLGHPHLVTVVDYGTSDTGEPYLVMDYLDGEDLHHRMRREGRLPLATTVAITRQVASALAAVHGQGVVHRDLKPANVFLVRVPDEADFVKVLDFGVSKIKAAHTRLTNSAHVLGTPEYMSPEQATGMLDEIDHRADQWSLACMAWEMLCGRPPFAGEGLVGVLYQVVNADPPPMDLGAADLPPAVETVLRRALAKRMEDRYPSIKEFARAFELAAFNYHRTITLLPVTGIPIGHALDAAVVPAAMKPSVYDLTAKIVCKVRAHGFKRLRLAALCGLVVLAGSLLLAWPRKPPQVAPTSPVVAPAAKAVVVAPTLAAGPAVVAARPPVPVQEPTSNPAKAVTLEDSPKAAKKPSPSAKVSGQGRARAAVRRSHSAFANPHQRHPIVDVL